MKNHNHEVTRATYNAVAPDYATRDEGTVDEAIYVRESLDWFVGALPSHAKVLDAGVGGGRDSRYFFKHGLAVTGIDFSPKMLAEAKHKQPNIDYRIMDLLELDLEPEAFDGIWANASLHHIEKADLPRVLEDLYRALKPGGYFVIIVKHGTGEGMRVNHQFDQDIRRYFAFYQSEEMRNLVERAGLRPLEIRLTTAKEWVEVRMAKP